MTLRDINKFHEQSHENGIETKNIDEAFKIELFIHCELGLFYDD
jgi:hypothetical protein